MTARYDCSTIPDSASVGLDLFAAAWLQRWTDNGGSVDIGDDGKAWIGYHADAPSLLPETADRASCWRDGAYNGAMRALLDLLGDVPGGGDAVKRHMLHHGMASMYGGAGL